MGLGVDGVRGKWASGQMGLGANGSGQRPHGKQHPGTSNSNDHQDGGDSRPPLTPYSYSHTCMMLISSKK